MRIRIPFTDKVLVLLPIVTTTFARHDLTEPTSATSRDLDLIAAVIEWRDARQPYTEAYKGPCTTIDGRRERQAKWERYSKAEARLMEVARRFPEAEKARRRIAA